MADQFTTVDHLLLLVGSNPLPNYLAALVLDPRVIHLFYSPETESVKDSLSKGLKKRQEKLILEEVCIREATNAAQVRAAFASLPQGAHLHYTGGTKIMAAHARMAFKDAGGRDDQASYLDERKGVLRFDTGYEIDLSKRAVDMSIDDILQLHGIERLSKRDNAGQSPTDADAGIIAAKVLNRPDLAEKLHGLHREERNLVSISKAKEQPVDLSGLLEGLSVLHFPEADWNKDTFKKWCDFLGGVWLERWCRGLVKNVAADSEIALGVDCRMPGGRQFEIDVAVVRGHRLYVISCTTDATMKLCKSKLFEVAMRARQLGGDLARSALVCLLHGSDPKGLYIAQLREDVDDIWSAPNTPQVFGLDDVKEWAGTDGRPNTRYLQQWLDS
ncbi:Card1-like endonuclease domain-containing protein [Desulfatiglans anilini]|uniref:Card1-like endonuclease domain-containing protein n=1 Tax=Desulfatiglans anilini TaxID=90728 RepID=UPI0005585156|nr:DUF1887 family protein [Desulfatiglans anilini]